MQSSTNFPWINSLALGCLLLSPSGFNHAQVVSVPPSIAAALADPGRPHSDVIRDSERMPAQLIALAGIKPGNTVVDIWPRDGYWSRIFSVLVGPAGHVIGYIPTDSPKMAVEASNNRKLAAEPGRGNLEIVVAPLSKPPVPAYQGTADVVWAFQYYHDIHDFPGFNLSDFNRVVLQRLKPGGIYMVVDHAAAAGTGLAHTDDLHRIDKAAVLQEVKAAGFDLVAESDLLHNSNDPHAVSANDPSMKGKTDQFILKFRKPLR